MSPEAIVFGFVIVPAFIWGLAFFLAGLSEWWNRQKDT